jgi:hypothetical protein
MRYHLTPIHCRPWLAACLPVERIESRVTFSGGSS